MGNLLRLRAQQELHVARSGAQMQLTMLVKLRKQSSVQLPSGQAEGRTQLPGERLDAACKGISATGPSAVREQPSSTTGDLGVDADRRRLCSLHLRPVDQHDDLLHGMLVGQFF